MARAEVDAELDAWIVTLPKAELHVHLEGSILPELALELARRRGVRLPGAEAGVEGLRERYRFQNFRDFLNLYVAISSCLCEAEDFRDAVIGVAAELKRNGVVYAESTFTPMTHTSSSCSRSPFQPSNLSLILTRRSSIV